ncbi:SAM-dependent methyltransferase [Tumebacillus algifaecis]|uniref:SAM-dependent methyltransferase n=1 Tax=Tumebacillus algifaecis TaxID=1214604 RepID=A0A223CYW1_9BACL|nr:SAM-dependent methyltransferase [Tumebacillus algifaecis]ASS74531.1 SAM-dependent methyltransferase [Tumebacillus algifaecis]
MNVSRFIGSSNFGFAQYAQEEIRRLFPGTKFRYLEPGEVFLIDVPARADEVTAALLEQEPIFLRHIQPVQHEIPLDKTADDLMRLIEFVQELRPFVAGEKVAVQARKVKAGKFAYTPFGVKDALDPILQQEQSVEPVVRGADKIISVYLSDGTCYLGISTPHENLSDWNGGMVRYRKEEEQVSRAKFKLLEAEERFNLDLSQFHNALDIGAAPGGWTSLLLERNLSVTAVDPGHMHASLLGHPNLTFLQKNAGDVKFEERAFDLLVCDMSWSPKQMSKLVAELLPAVETGGVAVITVKLMHKKPFQTVKETLQNLEPQVVLLQAKQLFHNREELTLYLMKEEL